jgi:hypothetical protein
MEHGLMEDRINKYNNNPDYDAGYEQAWDVGWQSAIEYVLDISKQMRYNDNLSWNNETLEELEQRIV